MAQRPGQRPEKKTAQEVPGAARAKGSWKNLKTWQEQEKLLPGRPPARRQHKKAVSNETSFGIQEAPLTEEVTGPSMSFGLASTSMQEHRVRSTEPFEATFEGTLETEAPIRWVLFATEPEAGAPPVLHFIEDVQGRSGSEYGEDLPLSWEISLNGGPWSSLQLNEDNSLSHLFGPGVHSFTLRATSPPLVRPDDGYYRLRLAQQLMPDL